MIKYFKWSILVTILGTIAAYFWGEHHIAQGSGLKCLFIVFILSVLEVSLSFDNAVVNALKLEKMSPTWQHRFLTWGIFIAVFGMRLLFPIAIVSMFSRISIMQTAQMAFYDAASYTKYLHEVHSSILAFGGIFLLMLFLTYIFNKNKKVHWIKPLENHLTKVGHINGVEVVISILALYFVQHFLAHEHQKLIVLLAGLCGLILYIMIHGLSEFMQSHSHDCDNNTTPVCQSFKSGFIAFLYLELIDASFSLDGVLGAFALSKDIIIITIGLTIGAMFVRSLTIMMVEKRTLAQYIYLEHGAHWAIGTLAVIMLISTSYEIPEVVTGLLGFVFIMIAYITSVIHNIKLKNKKEQSLIEKQ